MKSISADCCHVSSSAQARVCSVICLLRTREDNVQTITASCDISGCILPHSFYQSVHKACDCIVPELCMSQ
jgi:hypothetical protein